MKYLGVYSTKMNYKDAGLFKFYIRTPHTETISIMCSILTSLMVILYSMRECCSTSVSTAEASIEVAALVSPRIERAKRSDAVGYLCAVRLPAAAPPPLM